MSLLSEGTALPTQDVRKEMEQEMGQEMESEMEQETELEKEQKSEVEMEQGTGDSKERIVERDFFCFKKNFEKS